AVTVLILGFANLVADGFSMGASNFLAIRSNEAARAAPGLGVEEPHAGRHGFATFAAFLTAGAVPLAAYLVRRLDADRFAIDIMLTLTTLFTVAAFRSFVTKQSWIRSGLEMLLVGAAAAAVAYVLGAMIADIVGGSAIG